jgi:hypothetical protein
MDERLSLKAVDDYCDDYASKVTAGFFEKKDNITGPEILGVSTIEQVNFFVIRELMRAWHLEGQKLRSPYFDYTAAPVAEALAKFQNLLSNYISITRENFQPLLKKAAAQTLYLVVDPYDFFSDTLDRHGSTHVRTAELKRELRYLKINRAPLEKLVQRLEERKLDIVSGNEAFGLLDQILEEVNFTPEDVDTYVAQFSAVIPLALEKLYETKPAPVLLKKGERPVAKAPEKKTIAQQIQKGGSISESLTINQKFMFTKILFHGDFDVFTRAVEKLDRMNSVEQAKKYLAQTYPEWDTASEEYEEFIELLEQRLGS